MLAQPRLRINPVEDCFEFFEELERRLAHHCQHRVGGVLRSHFQTSGDVVANQFFVVAAVCAVDVGIAGHVHRQVVSHARANKRFFDARQSVDAPVYVEERPVVGVEVAARQGMQARGPEATRALLLVASAHAVHVGRGAAEVAYIALEIGHTCHLTGFADN